MGQQVGDDPQARKPGEHLLSELKMVHNALRHDLASLPLNAGCGR